MVCLMKVIAVLLYKYTKDKIRRVTFPTCTVHPASGYIVKMKTRYASQVQKAKWSYLVNVREYVKQLGNNLHIVMRYITWQLYVVLFSSIPPPPSNSFASCVFCRALISLSCGIPSCFLLIQRKTCCVYAIKEAQLLHVF